MDLKTAKKAADAVVATGIFSRQRGKGPYDDTYSVRDVHSLTAPEPHNLRPSLAPSKGAVNLKKRWRDPNGSKVEALEKTPR